MNRIQVVRRGLLLVSLIAGCASAPPPPEPSPLRRQAQAAVESGASRFAGRHYAASASAFGRAAEIYDALDDEASEASALRNQAEALRRAGKPDPATAGFERALQLDRAAGRTLAEALDRSGLARCASARGEDERALEESERALALARGAGAPSAAFEVDLAVYLLARGDAADRERIFALLESAGSPEHDARVRAAAHLNVGRALLRFGAPDRAEARLLAALAEFRALDDPEGVARSHEELGRLLLARGDTAAARAHLEQARRGYAFLGDAAAEAATEALLAPGPP